MSSQRPRIIINDHGICSGCLNADYKNHQVDWGKREKELQSLLTSTAGMMAIGM